MFKHINHDIKVSWVFTVVTYLVVFGIITVDVISGIQSLSINTLFYGFPLALLSIFFSRTAVRIQIDEANHKAVQTSFYLSLLITAISLIWLIISASLL